MCAPLPREESADHLVLGCPFARQVWFSVLLAWRLHSFTPRADDESETKNWWPRLSSAVTGDRRKEQLNSLVCRTLRMIWLERNDRVFEKNRGRGIGCFFLKRRQKVESVVILRTRTEFALWLLARTSGSADARQRRCTLCTELYWSLYCFLPLC